MLRFITRHKTAVIYLAAYFFAISIALRYLLYYQNDAYLIKVVALLAAFLILLGIQTLLRDRSRLYTHVILAVQTGILIVLSFLPPRLDFYSTLSVTLALQAVYVFSGKTAFRWIGVFATVTAVLLLLGQGWSRGLPLVVSNTVAVFVVGAFVVLIRRTEAAHRESQRLLSELERAHQQLQIYTAQAEQLAVVKDRNRLARDLHDSVSQTIFSMRLTADAVRILQQRNSTQVAPQLDKLQELAQSALDKMRTLIHELRPSIVAEHGLVPALRHHVTLMERQHKFAVVLDISGQPRLTDEEAEQIYHVVEEALNNVLKHAHTDKAILSLRSVSNRVTVKVKDNGKGFRLEDIDKEKNLGLAGMRERLESIGASLQIDSSPGEGTCITIEITSKGGGGEDG
ncbi:MAG: sensor histidine kinase [Spirochaetaceae bacterium]|nr:MAG: sensor histidine kinase [Spirochaetaceae bacterium]